MKQQWMVGILLFDHVDLIDMAGPYEVFHLAGYTARDLHKGLLGQDTPNDHPFLVRTVSSDGRPLQASNGLRL
jgi:putative intracellular protease/amidase